MPDINTTIGGYKLRSLLQTGQVSQVFEVVEPLSGRHFAMKVLLPEYAQSKPHRATMFHEAEIGIKMRHENVINILKVSKSPTEPHFVMEFFPSGSLRTRLQSRDPKDKEFLKLNAKKIFKQIATGLAYMNANGVVHCDVKADNILVNALGQTKIIDFAIAKRVKKGVLAKMFHKRGKPQGTPSFMSPEQIRGQLLDGRADIYGYAATLYELTTGRPPFRGNSVNDLLSKHLVEKPSSPQVYNPDLTDEFSALILKCLAKKKEDRPANFHEVLIELRKIKVYKSVPDEEEEVY
jgi:serine/threonine protein kinase